MDNKEPKLCQSCGMPLTEDLLGTEADGSKSHDYCKYCYMDGAFTAILTMEDMAEYCCADVDEYNTYTGQQLTKDEYRDMLMKYYPSLKRWQLSQDKLPSDEHPMKKVYIDEINALGIEGLHVDRLFVLQGTMVNQPYVINGNTVQLLDDSKMYWGLEVRKDDTRCYGVVCDEKYILVSEYGRDGVDAEIVMMKRRQGNV